MRRHVVIAGGRAVLLGGRQLDDRARERCSPSGRVVLLELAPVDPRSLMQGDYMALRFKVADDAFGSGVGERAATAMSSCSRWRRRRGRFAASTTGRRWRPTKLRLRYRWRNGLPKFATNAFFFEEGHASDYARRATANFA